MRSIRMITEISVMLRGVAKAACYANVTEN